MNCGQAVQQAQQNVRTSFTASSNTANGEKSSKRVRPNNASEDPSTAPKKGRVDPVDPLISLSKDIEVLKKIDPNSKGSQSNQSYAIGTKNAERKNPLGHEFREQLTNTPNVSVIRDNSCCVFGCRQKGIVSSMFIHSSKFALKPNHSNLVCFKHQMEFMKNRPELKGTAIRTPRKEEKNIAEKRNFTSSNASMKAAADKRMDTKKITSNSKELQRKTTFSSPAINRTKTKEYSMGTLGIPRSMPRSKNVKQSKSSAPRARSTPTDRRRHKVNDSTSSSKSNLVIEEIKYGQTFKTITKNKGKKTLTYIVRKESDRDFEAKFPHIFNKEFMSNKPKILSEVLVMGTKSINLPEGGSARFNVIFKGEELLFHIPLTCYYCKGRGSGVRIVCTNYHREGKRCTNAICGKCLGGVSSKLFEDVLYKKWACDSCRKTNPDPNWIIVSRSMVKAANNMDANRNINANRSYVLESDTSTDVEDESDGDWSAKEQDYGQVKEAGDNCEVPKGRQKTAIMRARSISLAHMCFRLFFWAREHKDVPRDNQNSDTLTFTLADPFQFPEEST